MRYCLLAALVLLVGLAGTSSWALDSKLDLVIDNDVRTFSPIVDCIEYEQIWDGEMSGEDTMGWSWDRVGFRVVDQSSTQQEAGPNLIGYGVTYGDIVIHNEYGALRGFAVAVEDPRKMYDGYYGRLVGLAADGSPFEGTLRFAETNDGTLHGEVDIVVNGGSTDEPKEVYFQPTAIDGKQSSGQTVKYSDAQPFTVYHNVVLEGTSTGTMSGPMEWTLDTVSLESGPYPLLDLAWSYLRRGDGWAVGEVQTIGPSVPPRPFGEGSIWLRIAETLAADPAVADYTGMSLARPRNGNDWMPAFTVEGDFSPLSGHFLGETEQLFCIPGDLDGDRKVGSSDLDTVRANWDTRTLAGEYLSGDCSRDGYVGSRDLDMIRSHWGGPYVTPVPEPGVAVLLLGVLVFGRRQKGEGRSER